MTLEGKKWRRLILRIALSAGGLGLIAGVMLGAFVAEMKADAGLLLGIKSDSFAVMAKCVSTGP